MTAKGAISQLAVFRLAGAGSLIVGFLIHGQRRRILQILGQFDRLFAVGPVHEEDLLALRRQEGLHHDVGGRAIFRPFLFGHQFVAGTERILDELQHPVTRVGLAIVVVHHGNAGKLRR